MFTLHLAGLSTPQTASQQAKSADGLQGGATSTRSAASAATINGVVTSFGPQFTVPAEADYGQPVLPNLIDPSEVTRPNSPSP